MIICEFCGKEINPIAICASAPNKVKYHAGCRFKANQQRRKKFGIIK